MVNISPLRCDVIGVTKGGAYSKTVTFFHSQSALPYYVHPAVTVGRNLTGDPATAV